MIYLVGLTALAAFLFAPRLENVVKSSDVENQFWINLSNKIKYYDSEFKARASQYGLDWKMLKAIAMIESWLGTYKGVVDTPEERAIAKNAPDSSDGLSAGLMQATLKTALDYDKSASFTRLQDPNYSIHFAAKHLKMLKGLSARWKVRDIEFMIKSYNQGQGNTAQEFSRPNNELTYVAAKKYWQKYLIAYNSIED